MANSAICSIDGCGKPVYARSYCRTHYGRYSRHGDPLVVLRGKDGPVHKWVDELLASLPSDECVAWPFGRHVSGYGRLTVDQRTHFANRYVCALAHGKPPTPKHHAAHSCGNGHLGCVNPRHLRWATTSENQGDRVHHGTSNRGERNGSGKLTEKQVRSIIERLTTGETQREIAATFGVSQQTVSDISTGRMWAWLQQESM